VRGGTGFDVLFGDVPGLFDPDSTADVFISGAGTGLDKENTGTPVKVESNKKVSKPPPPTVLKLTRIKKKKKGKAAHRQRHLPKATLKTPKTLGGKRVTNSDLPDPETFNRILSDFHKWATQTQNKDVEDLKEDLARADERAAGYETDKNLAVAETNKKRLVVESLKEQLSKKTILAEDEKDKADKLYDNAHRVQVEIRAHGQNHLSAFRQQVEKSVNEILDAAATLYRDLDGKLDGLTQANKTAHSTKRPADKPLYSKSPPPSSR